jgi:hypothetical protein
VKLYLAITDVEFSVTRNPEPKADQTGKQKFTKDGAPMWQTQVQALDDGGAEVLMLTTAGEKPKVTVRERVIPVGLEAIPWNTNGRHGVAYRASELKPVAVTASK